MSCLCCPPLLFDHAVQAFQRVGKAADAVDEAQLHRLLSIDHAAYVGRQFPRLEHQLRKVLPLHAAVAGDKRDDPVLDPFEIVKGLADTDDRPGQADRVDGHGRGGRDEGDLGRHRQGHPDGMPAAQYQGDRGLPHAGDEF